MEKSPFTKQIISGFETTQRLSDSYLCLNEILNIINTERALMSLGRVSMYNFAKQNRYAIKFINDFETKNRKKAYYKASKTSKGWISPLIAINLLKRYKKDFTLKNNDFLKKYVCENSFLSVDDNDIMISILWKYTKNKAFFAEKVREIEFQIQHFLAVSCLDKNSCEETKRELKLKRAIAKFVNSTGSVELGVELAFESFSNE